jgi:HD-like signal output (HDOD) protein
VSLDSIRSTTIGRETAKVEFAAKAARHFEANKNHWSFGNIQAGAYLALRWGLGDDCVLVIKQDENENAICYGQAIKKEEA